MGNAQKNVGVQASRRDFLKTTGLAAAGLAANLTTMSNVHAAGSDTIKVGVIGCGGRGSGAADNVLNSAPNVEVVAIGDAFKFRVDRCRQGLLKAAQGSE